MLFLCFEKYRSTVILSGSCSVNCGSVTASFNALSRLKNFPAFRLKKSTGECQGECPPELSRLQTKNYESSVQAAFATPKPCSPSSDE